MSEDQPAVDPGFDPNKINEVEADRLRFPERYSRESFAAPEGLAISEFERTPEGYLELEWQHRDVQRALALDFDHFVGSTLTHDKLVETAMPFVAAMNESRSGLQQSNGSEPLAPLEAEKLNDTLLRHLICPKWQEHMPDGSEDGEVAWEKFKAQYPEHIQINLEELRELDGKMRILSNDPELTAEVRSIHAERIEVMRAASAFLGADRKIDFISRRIAELYRAAGTSNRSLTTAEQRHIDRLQAQQAQISSTKGREITTPEMKQEVGSEIRRRRFIQNRRDFERGLVLTDQMKATINELLPSLAAGKPVLLVGETGGAKTALAEYIPRHYFGEEPEFVSGYGDVNSYQLMGKMSLTNENGATVSEFLPGPAIRAMEAGKPLILDEINAMPPEFLKRLNKIVQLRPGDKLIVQEDSGREVTIKPGFVIIATMNEKSKRYKGVEDLSVEFQNRFGANVVRVYYPDHNVVHGQPPIENSIIARAALTDRAGGLVAGISPAQLESFVRACHVSQQVFSGNNGNGYVDFVQPERIADNKPGLDEAVLAPRTMVAILEKVRDSYGQVTLEQAIERFVSGIKGKNDKQVMTSILQGQGFLGNG